MGKSSSSSGGVSFTGLLQVAFIVLKLTNVIKWKWVWVLSPCWIALVLVAIVVCIVLFMDD